MQIRQGLKKFSDFKPVARKYLLEAIFSLIAARLALWLLPYRWLIPAFQRQTATPAASYARRRKIWQATPVKTYTAEKNTVSDGERKCLCAGIPTLINEAAFFLPRETTCFARAIAAQIILRRLGISTTMVYGAAKKPNTGLTAHVWLRTGTEGVIGHETAEEYHVLATYPPELDPLSKTPNTG